MITKRNLKDPKSVTRTNYKVSDKLQLSTYYLGLNVCLIKNINS